MVDASIPDAAPHDRLPLTAHLSLLTAHHSPLTANMPYNKTILITGASSGIGKATAKLFAANGAKLALVARSADRLEAVVREIGGDTLGLPCDVTSVDQLQNSVQTAIKRFGRLDALFANAGIYLAGDIADGNPSAWAELVDINIKGVLNSVHTVLPAFLEQAAGDILICSSISGHQAIHWEPVYSASKHAIQAFTHGLRRQLLQKGIRVGAIAPGMVLNELWGLHDQSEIDRRADLGEGLRSEDVAEAVLFMLTRPSNVTIRDLVMLPRTQDL
jgi:ribitol 2-dehydrogenase